MAITFKSFTAKLGTPLAIAFFVMMALSGVMLFFKLGANFVKSMHEWLGLVFILAVALHVLRNTKPFLGYLRLSNFWWIAGLTLATAAAFVVPSALRATPVNKAGVNVLTARAQKATLPDLAALLGTTGPALATALQAKGLTVPHERASLEEVAKASGRETREAFDAALGQAAPGGAAKGRPGVAK